MKKIFLPLLLASALAAPTALIAGAFEGKMHMQLFSGGKKDAPQEMEYRIKDDLIRIDMQAKEKSGKRAEAAPGIIMDAKKQEMTILMPEQQMYMVRSIAADAQAVPHEGTKKSEATIEKTGETETILGYKCEKYITKDEKSSTAMWLTTELGSFMGLGSGGGGFGGRRGANSEQAQAWEKALAGKNVFPLRVVNSTLAGKESFRMEVTAIEKQSLPAADFVAPPGWKKFEMPNMGDMMKGMMGGGH